MYAVDSGLQAAGIKAYTALPGGVPFAVLLFDLEQAQLAAVIEADRLGQLRTGAACGVAAQYLARPEARHARGDRLRLAGGAQVACIRAAVPAIERVVAFCRNEERLRAVLRRARRGAGRDRTARRPSRTSSSR